MTLKSDAKFKEKLTCGFQYGMKGLVNFPKYIRFELKKIQLSFKVGRKTDFLFEKFHEEFGEL